MVTQGRVSNISVATTAAHIVSRKEIFLQSAEASGGDHFSLADLKYYST